LHDEIGEDDGQAPKEYHMRRFIHIMLALSTGLLGYAAQAASVTRTMPEGGKLLLFGYTALNPDCTSAGEIVVRVMSAPSHGVVTMKRGTTFPNFPSSNPREACNRRRAPSLNVEYRPERGFLGTDYITLDVFCPDGCNRTDQFTINVK